MNQASNTTNQKNITLLYFFFENTSISLVNKLKWSVRTVRFGSVGSSSAGVPNAKHFSESLASTTHKKTFPRGSLQKCKPRLWTKIFLQKNPPRNIQFQLLSISTKYSFHMFENSTFINSDAKIIRSVQRLFPHQQENNFVLRSSNIELLEINYSSLNIVYRHWGSGQPSGPRHQIFTIQQSLGQVNISPVPQITPISIPTPLSLRLSPLLLI